MSIQNQLRWGAVVTMGAGFLIVIAAMLRGFGLAPLLGQWAIFTYVILLFFAFTTIYASQGERMGKLGLAGFILAVIGLGFTEIIAFLILAGFAGLPAAHDVQMSAWSQIPILHLAVLCDSAGGILLGLATMRAAVLPRWAGALLIAGQVTNVAHEYLLPLPALMIVPAILMAGAFVGLGWAIWTRGQAPVMRPQLAP